MNDNYLVLKMCIQWFNTEYTIKKSRKNEGTFFFILEILGINGLAKHDHLKSLQ